MTADSHERENRGLLQGASALVLAQNIWPVELMPPSLYNIRGTRSSDIIPYGALSLCASVFAHGLLHNICAL
jgi:hypothetical protein